MKKIIPQFEFTVFDFETTGYSPKNGAEIIEVGAVRISEGELDETFRDFINPRRSLPQKIIKLTGITPEKLEKARSSREVIQDFHHYIDDSILVAHNASFDLSFLNYYSPEEIENPHIDSLRMARKIGNFSSNTLDDLVFELNISRSNAHRALDDALATARLFLHLAEKINSPIDYKKCKIPQFITETALATD